MRIAVVSTDGTNVDDHFGKATRFLVFDLDGERQTLVANRPVSPLSSGAPGHAFDPGRFASLAEALEDCQQVYCTRIGKKPATELEARGVDTVVYHGPIDQITP